MKSIVTIFCVASFFFAKAQDSTIGLSKFEIMVTTPGKFYNIEEKIIGNILGQNITVIKIRDFNGDESSSFVRISSKPGIDSIVPFISNTNLYFSKDDVMAVIKNLEFYSSEIKKNKVSLNSYFLFVTSTDVRLTYRFHVGFSSDLYLEMCKLHPYSRTPVRSSVLEFRKKDMDNILVLLKLAATQM